MTKDRFSETTFSIAHRFSFGSDLHTGGFYLAIPVSNGAVDYNEYYRVNGELARSFATDSDSTIAFAEACHRREHDDLLLYQPDGRRGAPI
ncbi:hypothetical protein ACXYX3_04255 [Mycobacterium sp. C3-094]